MLELLINYANKNNIISELNEKDENGNYPLFLACYNNHIEIVKLLFDYAIKNNIILELNGKNKNVYY